MRAAESVRSVVTTNRVSNAIRWRVSGTMGLDDFRREYPELVEVPGINTMGGLVVSLMEVVPLVGQSVMHGNLKLTAQAADARRVREVLVEANQKR